MAAFKVKSNVLLLALVALTLISTVAGSPKEKDPNVKTKTKIKLLRNKIKRVSDEPKKVEKMLKNYERPDDKIGPHSVRKLVELCQESLDKCFDDELRHIASVADSYKWSFLYMESYVDHCRGKMQNFCVENIETVTENLLNSVTEEEKEIAKPFWESVRSSGLMERAHENAIALGVYSRDSTNKENDGKDHKEGREKIRGEVRESYLMHRKEKCGTNPSADDMELFFFHFLRSMYRYRDIYLFYNQIQKGDESAPNLKDGTAIDLFKFARIAYMLCRELTGTFFKEFEAKMTREYGCIYNLGSYKFRTQTEEKLLESRQILKDIKAKRRLHYIKRIFDSLELCFDLNQY